MTQKEINKFLDNTKVYTNGKSKEIQEKLFLLDYYWNNENNKEIKNLDEPFLYIHENRTITWGCSMRVFVQHKYHEISAEEILSIVLTEPAYRPFKNQEECWAEMQKHQPFGWVTDRIKSHSVNSINNLYIWHSDNVCYTFEEAFNIYTFADGTPFGVEKD